MPRLAILARQRQVFRLAAPPAWVSWAIVVLGVVSAALEAAGLSLFIPLVQTLGGGTGAKSVLGGLFAHLLGPIPRATWVPIFVGALCFSIAAKNGVSYLAYYLVRKLDGLVAHRLRLRVLEQTISSCIDYKASSKGADIVSTLTNNTSKVAQALSLIYRLMVCACTCLVFLGLLLFLSARLTAVAIVMLAASVGVTHLLTRRVHAASKSVVEHDKRFGLRMWEAVGSLPLIRSFGRERYEVERCSHASDFLRRRILDLELTWGIAGPMSEIIGALLIGALILAGVGAGADLGSLAAFLAVLYRLQAPTRELLDSKVALNGLRGAVEDVDTFLFHTREPYLESGSTPAPRLQSGLEFRGVSFRYGQEEPLALDDVSFFVPAGKTTAIVGQSGAGKSTLMSLILRLRDPVAGVVLADGVPLPELELQAWRARLSLMAQEPQLFNGTVAENLRYGRLSASPADLAHAADIAGAREFIEQLPEGYGTELGDRGMRLSGGQRQRIALARTILRAPDLLLLDEPTNALDVDTEQAFRTALETYSQGRTVVVIAHRLTTVQNADQIVVLDGGRVVEAGAPADLLARPGQFARMYGLQQGAGPATREVA